ncbi:bifunctional 6-phosphofructo-2-kinase fructose-2,6-bisphosphate 2-phosphatase [Raphidocelis subcapitata]|uniref:Bifunctional 6-phosphofructo-2-kinase fructose-2,6-bisphosphate 2-phosphatase n=1 Tax=Raphidocelis subcapitata TaxID=307507 RepID=A0A2V0P5X8_9CHLO|nr:bifunctional 6-phosphofructo-2-kinase fructose-2,6-bisphosphate 2-phosphatase [Raphidocelis subcapitata]|eukprot:GBF94979.1 bifunctional 6-phosphofructo-2-kinase fructose-2,6-bisphosphate 2-phosphatase [Raphidocelis subcapitata]
MWEFWRGKLGKQGRRGEPRTLAGAASAPERRSLQVVNFKDLNLSVDDELESEESWEPGAPGDEDPTNKGAIIHRQGSASRGIVQKNKLIIIMVGLPGRGKTFLCNKLKCYLNWLGHTTAHFNVGNYRRRQKGEDERQDAHFFDARNQQGLVARHRALDAALADMMAWLSTTGQVAIFDATNTTEERRRLLIDTFHGKFQYMFLESICNDNDVLQSNYRYKMKFSPDYEGVDTETAIADFMERIKKYEQVYEPISDRRLHYIKLIDMVTGRGHMDVNRISGYIPGKIVFFLMQICKAGMAAGQTRKIWLTRHGESEYNVAGRIGAMDGMTYPDIAQSFPVDFEARKRDKLTYRYPAGESYLDVIQRLEPVVIEMEREREYVVVVGHQAVLRAIFGYFTATPPRDIPRLDIPLHTLIELQPRPDGTMEVTKLPVPLSIPRSLGGAGGSSGGSGSAGSSGDGGARGLGQVSQSSSSASLAASEKGAASGPHRRCQSFGGGSPGSPSLFGFPALRGAGGSGSGGGASGPLPPAGGSAPLPPRPPADAGAAPSFVAAALPAAAAHSPVHSLDAECGIDACGADGAGGAAAAGGESFAFRLPPRVGSGSSAGGGGTAGGFGGAGAGAGAGAGERRQ